MNEISINKEYKDAKIDSDAYWSEKALQLAWTKPFTQVSDVDFKKPVHIKWFQDGQLNVTESCIDRHAARTPSRIAYTWIPEDPKSVPLDITYQELSRHVNRLANGLREMGIKKGDRVTLYLPMIPEAVYSMLACARIGAPHSVIFAGFSPQSIADRIEDCQSEWLITADQGIRGNKLIPLKENVDKALALTKRVQKVLVVEHTKADIHWEPGRDISYSQLVKNQSTECPAETMNAEDPLFILYTSGSTGKPKGVLHTAAGYLTYAAHTHKMVFDLQQSDVYWCAADIGWITGHSYIVYGPLANGATSVLYEGLPTYPTCSRIWQIVDQMKVTSLYTAPTLIRALMREGDEPVNSTSRKSLRLLGSVGEPINPEAWNWYHKVVGGSRCPIVDTWWQTETGGILISPLVTTKNLKPGCATKPLPGIEPVLLDDQGKELGKDAIGHLCIKKSWPGQMRTVYGDHERFYQTYFSQFAGHYYTGDECRVDEDGCFWILGRADDVINVSGHRLGTAEIESALVSHPTVAEAAVVGFPHNIKGQGIYAFVSLKLSASPSAKLELELIEQVKNEIGSLAKPDIIQWAPALPKTRSGKIMRRILKKIAANDLDNLGDTTTLADPEVVKKLAADRKTTL